MTPTIMKAVVKESAGPGLVLAERRVPRPASGEVLVRVTAASVCGTDSLIHDWAPWAAARVRPPVTIGHEFAGLVVEPGHGVSGFPPGARVSAESHIFCGTCELCRTGFHEVCQNVRILGVDTDGSFAQYLAIPARNLWLNHPGIPDRIATLQEPLGNAVDTVLAEDVAGKSVLVAGAGPMGLMCAAVARACGAAQVLVSDPNPYRLGLATALGADALINPREAPLVEAVLGQTKGLGADVLLEVSGNEAALSDGLAALKPGGRVSLLGIFKGPVSVALNERVIFTRVRVYGITGRKVFGTWRTVDALLASGRLNLGPLVTHELALGDYAQAFTLMASGECGKVVFNL